MTEQNCVADRTTVQHDITDNVHGNLLDPLNSVKTRAN